MMGLLGGEYMADPQVEKQTYGAFERLLYIFLIPLIFVTVLLGVLLSLFDYDVMNSLLKVANKVPGIEKFIPDPKVETKAPPLQNPIKNEEEPDPAQLTAKQAQLENEILLSAQTVAEKDKTINDLKAQITAMEESLKAKSQTDEKYQAQIKQLASVYASMSPSKSAPVVQSLTLKEQVLVLSEMGQEEQVKILEKMNPQAAAEASIALKDLIPAKDLQIAALQERLKLHETDKQAAEPAKENLGRTFTEMVPKSAASILIEMNGIDSKKVLSILQSMDDGGRARVLAAMADVDKALTASISSNLAQ
jgi:flagellar motility protein MotE (MotC chaperone)